MNFDFEKEVYSDYDVLNMPSTTLAFVGDALFSLFVKVKVLNKFSKSGKFHTLSTKIVNAHSQKMILERLEPILNEQEKDVVRRAKNTHTSSKSKNSGLADYKKATAFEALLGYLYLTKREQRLNEILNLSFEVEL